MKVESSPSSSHRLLRTGRALWLLYAVGFLVVGLASLPGYYDRVIAGTVPPGMDFDISYPAGNAFFAARAAEADLPLSQFLVANIAASLLILAVHYGVAGLIIWRLPDSWFGLLSATVILLTGSAALEDATQVAGVIDRLGPLPLLLVNLGALAWPILPVWLYLFPDGRAVPRWVRWPLGILMGLFMIIMGLAILDAIGLLPQAIWQLMMAANERADFILGLVLPGLILALGSQVYRFARVSGPAERQQTKWFLFGLVVLVATFVLPSVFPLFARLEAVNGSIGISVIPVTIAIALLRYRLWDVDVVIRRTVGYAILTGLLALVYFSSVVILQRLLAPLTGDSTLATILSTLLIAVLFLPLRRRIQSAIDRRFFRRKYNAEQVLADFAATARDETDLDRLTAELLRVIQETMEPEHVSIWLRPGAKRRPTDLGKLVEDRETPG